MEKDDQRNDMRADSREKQIASFLTNILGLLFVLGCAALFFNVIPMAKTLFGILFVAITLAIIFSKVK